ncbi:MAG: hypothetical protein PHC90_14360 [Syntrophorhabdaceae bacterium]|nr:hypothetical protein [Syntrophorhabdaceae bacterium]
MNIYQVELTNRCNASCNYCPHSAMTRKQSDMSVPTFLYCLDRMKNQYIGLHHFGEPFLHNSLSDFIAIAHHHHIEVEFSTNGGIKDYQKSLRLVLDQEPYRMRIAYDFFEPVDFIKDALTFNKNTIITLHSVDGKLKEKKPYTNFAGSVKGSSEIKGECFFKKYNYFCVLWNGDIVPCCCDYNGQEILGNVKDPKSAYLKQQKWYHLCKNCRGMQFAEGGLWWKEI